MAVHIRWYRTHSEAAATRCPVAVVMHFAHQSSRGAEDSGCIEAAHYTGSRDHRREVVVKWVGLAEGARGEEPSIRFL